MALRFETIGDISIIQIRGRLEAANRDELKSAVDARLADQQDKFLLDLGQLEFIDSSGLGCLVSCLRSADKAGGALKIVSLRDYVAKLFETTRLDRVFEVYPDRDKALKSF
jgi:anti-sigma B factor antagonist